MDEVLAEKTKNVMRSIALLDNRPDFERQANGEASIIVALPNEPIGEVARRMKHVSAPVNLVIAYSDYFEVLTVARAAKEFKVMVVNHDLSMGMLSIKLKKNPGKTIRLDFASADDRERQITVLPHFSYA